MWGSAPLTMQRHQLYRNLVFLSLRQNALLDIYFLGEEFICTRGCEKSTLVFRIKAYQFLLQNGPFEILFNSKFLFFFFFFPNSYVLFLLSFFFLCDVTTFLYIEVSGSVKLQHLNRKRSQIL